MELTGRELKIVRYTDGVMHPEEKNIFLAEVEADPELREGLAIENTIQSVLRADAANIEQNEIFDTIPGAPLIERLAATAVSSNRKIIFFAICAAVLLSILALVIFHSEHPVQNPISSPVPKQIEQSVPKVTTPSQPTNLSPEEHLRIKTEIDKDDVGVKTPAKTTKGIDLDQDLNGKPKVFTDPKGHMQIK